MDGLTVAQTEYDRELKARRDAEAEVTRLRVLLSGQAVRLTAISGESKRQEVHKQLARELSDKMSTLERDLSKLKVERGLKAFGMKEEDVDKAADIAVSNPYWNPREVEREAVRELIRRAWVGEDARSDL